MEVMLNQTMQVAELRQYLHQNTQIIHPLDNRINPS
ncbi:MAG: hypothetical protein BWY82_02260 [Verrucomicrobia bacterium ADurb.Bin474]|nr:MAG: hypothetical protein BWY82_02260 [Verrucomicrobia bacterium ADurb.Bin474]